MTWLRAAVLGTALASAAVAQLELRTVNGSAETAVGAVFDLGSFYTGESGTTHFRIRNVGSAAATLNMLTVAGVGFTLSDGPATPSGVAAGAAVDFNVIFRAGNVGSYSAAVTITGAATVLTAKVVPGLTYSAGSQALGTAAVSFGTIESGAAAVVHFTVDNLTAAATIVPAIAVQGAGFSLSGPSPAGNLLGVQERTAFDITFQAGATVGPAAGSVAIGDRSYGLTATVVAPPLPRASMAIALPQRLSAQQGTVTVNLDAASRTAGSGTVTVDFVPTPGGAIDSAIAFASGGRTANFTVTAGDTQGRFGSAAAIAFQTGTTAGTLVFTVTLCGVTSQQSVAIAAAPVGVSAVETSRALGTVAVQVTGFDNTRTAGKLGFTFFDAAGNEMAVVDGAADFAGYFGKSDLGGAFLLKAVFPVTGDTGQIAAVEVQLTNAAGISKTGRTKF